MTLSKNHILDKITDELDFKKKESKFILESLLRIIKNTLENGDDLLISGFGKFRVLEKKERRGRNPATGDDLMLEPRRVVTFKCSDKLREKMNGRKI